MVWIEEKPLPASTPEPRMAKSRMWEQGPPDSGRYGWKLPDFIKKANMQGRGESLSWYFMNEPPQDFDSIMGEISVDTSALSTSEDTDDSFWRFDSPERHAPRELEAPREPQEPQVPRVPEPCPRAAPAAAPAPTLAVLVDSPGLELTRYDLGCGSEMVLTLQSGATLFGSAGEVELRVGRWGGSKLPGNEYFYVPAGMQFTIQSSEGGSVLIAVSRDGGGSIQGQQRGHMGPA